MATEGLVRTGVSASREAVGAFARRHRHHPLEALPWAAAIAAYAVFPSYLPLGSQILATILFALSADLVLGYAGIVTLGHAAFFGTGAYTAGILAANGWGEPITGLLAAALVAALVGFLSGLVVLRTTGLALLMQTLVVATLIYEAANKASRFTGGDDGLQGMDVWPIFGAFRFDLARGELFRGGDIVHLTSAEAGLLSSLAAQAGAAVSREDLAQSAPLRGNIRNVDVQMTRLRRKIEPDPHYPRYLQTVRGTGYALKPE